MIALSAIFLAVAIFFTFCILAGYVRSIGLAIRSQTQTSTITVQEKSTVYIVTIAWVAFFVLRSW